MDYLYSLAPIALTVVATTVLSWCLWHIMDGNKQNVVNLYNNIGAAPAQPRGKSRPPRPHRVGRRPRRIRR